jgi:ABC-2 type transport system permease protein
MNTMKWLVRREFWEHKGSFFWAPLVIGALLFAFMGAAMLYAIGVHGLSPTVIVNGHELSRAAVFHALPAETRAEIANVLANNYLAVSAPLFVMLPAGVFFYCLAALYDERRDRSILFWKSLPVSDQQTVLSKVITALCLAPLITIVIGSATGLAMLLFACTTLAFNGVNLFGALLASPSLYLAPFNLLGLLPVYILWALPTVGWLLMVSSWARSKVFLWAVGVPILAIVIIKWASFLMMQATGEGLDVSWFTHNIVLRGLGGLIPGIWLPFEKVSPLALQSANHHGVNLSGVFTESWMTLAGPSVWIGAAAGAAMIFAAMRLRRWRDEG